MVYQRIIPAVHTFVWAALLGLAAAALVVFVGRRYGAQRVRLVTMIPLAALLFFLLGMNGHLLDLNYSSRPLARQIAQAAPATTDVAIVNIGGAAGVRRDIVYGLAFYRNQKIVDYTLDGVPDEAHILVLPTRDTLPTRPVAPGPPLSADLPLRDAGPLRLQGLSSELRARSARATTC